MTTLCMVMLAHNDAPQVLRLRRALGDVPVVMHCDAKTSMEAFTAMTVASAGAVRTIGRADTRLASWSLVDAELRGIAEAMRWTDADYIGICSGSDYPLLPPDEIDQEIRALDGHSWIWNVPVPFARWNSRLFSDGGVWRLKYRYLRRHDNIISLRGNPVPIPIRRRIPAELTLRAASQWKIYTREDAQALLQVVRERPDLIRFWRSTFTPDESFAATTLASPSVTGRPALDVDESSAWHIVWGDDQQHPDWIDESALEELQGSARALVYPRKSLFARKFRSGSSDAILDLIDTDLRQVVAGPRPEGDT